jgi:hypothetical protein
LSKNAYKNPSLLFLKNGANSIHSEKSSIITNTYSLRQTIKKLHNPTKSKFHYNQNPTIANEEWVH